MKRILSLVSLALLVAGCRSADASEERTFPVAAPLPAAGLAPLELVALGRVTLQAPDTLSVHRVGDVHVTPQAIYIVDEGAKRVLAFAPDGRLRGLIGRSGLDDDAYEDPYRVAVRHDSVFVLDLGRFSHVPVYRPDGSHLGGVDWTNERMPTDLRLTADGMLVTTTVASDGSTGPEYLHIVGPGGITRATGCRVNPRVLSSDRRGGMLGALTFTSVSALGDRIYCAQPTTPVVFVVDTAGRPLPPIRLAPPFYVPPRDMPLTTNTRRALGFTGSFTTHAGFEPTPHGFISTYSRYDTTAQQHRYSLFACDSAGGPRRCGVLPLGARVLRVATPDTVITEERGAAGAVVIATYQLRFRGR